MRISTNVLFETGSNRLSELQINLAKVQEQIASGRRILTPADDPVGAAQALEITQAQSVNAQYAVNREHAENSLSLEESTLQSVTALLQDVKTVLVQAGNGTLDDTQRKFLATELSGRLEDLMGLANTRDGVGNYLFSGFQTTAQPFAKTITGALYSGDQGQRLLQVSASRKIEVSDTGSKVFESNKTGNGTFVTAAAVANTGSGVASLGTIVNSAVLTGNNYNINFTSANTFDIVNATTSATLSSGNAYVSGQAITFDGIQFDISGTPANGDQFTVRPSGKQSIFTTLTTLVNTLNAPVAGAAGKAAYTAALSSADNNLNNSLDNVLTVRASIGARLKELDSLGNEGEGRDIQYAKTLAELQELDYTKAITDLTKNKIMLEAAQQSFVKTANLSLFNFI